ncbi:MAG TPA: heme-binding protein [Candidatus Thermoplasmatota archaeon]|nr:heme-binding protein [Candidatus Thermoplasmatota archaeon]
MTETIPYTVLKKMGTIEIRQYPEVLFAVVENDEYDSGFNLLFRYITGENTSRRKIPMTAPVVTPEKIAMTAPVVTRENYMAFAIPSSYTKDTVPTPTNTSVHIEVQPEKVLAVVRFSGRAHESSVQKYTQALLSALKDQNIRVKGEPVLMRYNSPFTPGFLRRNEVAVEILFLK